MAYINGKKLLQVVQVVGGGGSSNISFDNVAVNTSAFVSSVAYNDYPYEATIITDSSLQNIDAQGGLVTFDVTEANSSNYSSVANLDTANGTITIYAKEIPSANFTIPNIVIYM